MKKLEHPNWRLLLPAEEIQTQLQFLAEMVAEEVSGSELLVVGLLESARRMVEDLEQVWQKMGVSVAIAWIGVNSYQQLGVKNETHQVWRDFSSSDRDKLLGATKVIVADDMVDTGGTMKFVVQHLESLGLNPEQIKTLVLLQKVYSEFFPSYVGFKGISDWVAGYGINGNSVDDLGPADGRDLDDIYAKMLAPVGMEKE